MNTKRIKFKNKEGNMLSARLELPVDQDPRVFAVFAHCFTCSKDLKAVVNISRVLTSHGIGVLRFDFTGLGESQGEFSDSNFTTNVGDIISAGTYLEKEYAAPQILIGHSLGGAAVLKAAFEMPEVKAVVGLAAPSDPFHVKNLFNDDEETIMKKGSAKVQIAGRPFKITKQLIEDLREHQILPKLKDLDKALLILHSPQDKIVGISNAREIYEAAMHPKSFVTLDGADHLLSNKEDSHYAGSIIASWVSRYIDYEADEEEAPKGVIARTGDDGYTTMVRTGKHRFLVDEPEAVGGKNMGPTPYDLLSAALGACTSMTLRMYADRKKWDLKEVWVNVQHGKTHSEDCENCESKSAKVDEFKREIELIGELDQEQKDRLLEIADRCPVHRTLHNEIKVSTRLKD